MKIRKKQRKVKSSYEQNLPTFCSADGRLLRLPNREYFQEKEKTLAMIWKQCMLYDSACYKNATKMWMGPCGDCASQYQFAESLIFGVIYSRL